MRAHSSAQGIGELSSVTVSLDPFLIFFMLSLAIGIIYMVGIEPMATVHNAFHDLRHATGFPCH